MADGLGQPDVVPLQAGAAAQPIVPNVQPQVTPDAVNALVNAMHNGFVNTQDIVDRIGTLGQAKKRAMIEEMQEYVSPDAIKARMAQHQLAGAQSQAQLGLVQPQADVLANQLALQQATTTYGQGGIQAIQTLGPWYGQSMDNFIDPKTGKIDYGKAAQAGNEIAAKNAIINNWFDRLTPAKEEDVVDTDGTTKHVTYNKFGQVVSPPNPQLGYKGSDTYWYIVNQLDNLMPQTHPLRGAIPAGHAIESSDEHYGGIGPASNSEDAPVKVTPLNKAQIQGSYYNYLIGQGVEDTEAVKMAAKADPETLEAFANEAFKQPNVAPQNAAGYVARGLPVPTLPTPNAGAAGAPQPAIESATGATPPAEPQTPAGLFSGAGPVVKPAQTPVEQRKEVLEARKNLRTLPDIDEYYKALPTYTKFADSARRAPIDQNGPTDLGLAENYSKMHDPTSTLREFKFDALTKVIPLLEKFQDAKAMIDREHIFPPKVRQAIIEDGMRTVDAAEKAVVPTFQAAEKTLPGTLDSEQRQIVNGVPFSQRHGHSYTPAATNRGAGTTLSSGKTVYFVPNPPTQ